jgi:nicotinamide-nucleotide amidase
VKAEIISIGTELLLGEITDTNASYLAAELPLLGIDLYWVTQVGDNMGRLHEALERAWSRSDLILATGGLGPTDDDITREAIAELLGEELCSDPELEQELRQRFAQLGRSMSQSNLKQASRIPSAQALSNIRGTAPGWWVEHQGRTIIALPGPPGEMQAMWRKEILPRLRQRMTGEVILCRTLKTFGLPEAAVGEMVSSWMASANPTLGIYAKPDGIHLRIAAKATRPEQANKMLAQLEEKLKSLLGERIWGTDEDTLETMVGGLLREKGLSLVTMESCTGGLLASTITDVPGSSNYFKGGLVAYSNQIKELWGVPAELITQHGAVSAEVALAMATAVRQRLGADIGLSTTGVAGPEPLEGKPIGTVFVGVDDGRKGRAVQGNYPPPRLQIKRRATVAALFELRKSLLSQD